MEKEKVTKKRSYRFLFTFIAAMAILSLFVYAITRPSLQSKALRELSSCYQIDDVKSCWDKYRIELHEEQEFVDGVRQKLASFNLSPEEISQCKKWLPAPPKNLNVIVVPDLSKRISDVLNNPGQVSNDTVILNSIYKSFVGITKTRTNSKDRLLVDVTDDAQAGGNFRSLANDLIYDLSLHKNQSNRLYFDKRNGQFSRNIDSLYALALVKPIGADFWTYFNNDLPNKILPSTLFEDYRNILIIITDGYLEANYNERTGVALYTGSHPQRAAICQQVRNGKELQSAVNETIANVRECQKHFPDLEVLILEVNERKMRSNQEPKDPGTVCDYDILKTLWADWFKSLEIKNAGSNFFVRRNNATQLTNEEIGSFLNQVPL